MSSAPNSSDPAAGSSKIYTKGGDKGKTSLIGGTRVSKAHLRLETYGTVDELNSVIGVLRSTLDEAHVQSELEHVQNELFNVGSCLACEDPTMRAQLPSVAAEEISTLETAMDFYSSKLTPLKNFILPGGSPESAQAHIARTVCRRAERACVALSETAEGEVDAHVIQYLNRLSDYFFVVARYLNHLKGVNEPTWGRKTRL